MIGMAKTQASGVSIPSSYEVFLNPTSITVFSSNGSASSPIIRSDVTGGFGPFEYLWTITGSDIQISAETSSETIFASGGFFVTRSETATLTVTDTGNGNAETSAEISVTFIFGLDL